MSGIPAERLREGQTILVKGFISFSRLARLIEGAELDKRVADGRKRGQLYPTTVPHTTISLIDAAIDFADQAAPTLEEQYVAEKLYAVKNGDNAGKIGFNIDDKSAYLPAVFEPNPEKAGTHRQVILDSDLASGIPVTLVLNTFGSDKYAKKGLGLQQVILHEPVRYYSQGVDTSALAARGIVIDGPITRVAGVDSMAAAPAPAELPAGTTTDGNGYPVPAPAPAQAVAQAVAQAPTAQAPVYAQPAPVAAPAPQPVAQAQAPVAAAPAPGSIEEMEARLAQMKANAGAGQGQSAFDPAPAADPSAGPWSTEGAGVQYNGQ